MRNPFVTVSVTRLCPAAVSRSSGVVGLAHCRWLVVTANNRAQYGKWGRSPRCPAPQSRGTHRQDSSKSITGLVPGWVKSPSLETTEAPRQRPTAAIRASALERFSPDGLISSTTLAANCTVRSSPDSTVLQVNLLMASTMLANKTFPIPTSTPVYASAGKDDLVIAVVDVYSAVPRYRRGSRKENHVQDLRSSSNGRYIRSVDIYLYSARYSHSSPAPSSVSIRVSRGNLSGPSTRSEPSSRY